jgi:hypothetical protein
MIPKIIKMLEKRGWTTEGPVKREEYHLWDYYPPGYTETRPTFPLAPPTNVPIARLVWYTLRGTQLWQLMESVEFPQFKFIQRGFTYSNFVTTFYDRDMPESRLQ